MDDLLEQFLIEGRELVEQASDDLMALERNAIGRGPFGQRVPRHSHAQGFGRAVRFCANGRRASCGRRSARDSSISKKVGGQPQYDRCASRMHRRKRALDRSRSQARGVCLQARNGKGSSLSETLMRPCRLDGVARRGSDRTTDQSDAVPSSQPDLCLPPTAQADDNVHVSCGSTRRASTLWSIWSES